MQNIKNVILQLIKYSIVDEQIQDVLINQLNQEQDNKLDLALLAEQLENTVKYNDFPLLTKTMAQDIQIQKKAQERIEQQIQLIKQSINQIDYQCLNKANKMDIEIQQKNITKIQQELDEYNYKIVEITEQQECITTQLEHLVAEEYLKQMETIQKNVSQSVLQSLNSQLSMNFAKYDKVVQGFEKIQNTLDTKADQSQYVEIMQSKISLQQYHSLKNKFQDIQGNFRYLIEAILDYFEAANSETESINMKKSDMIKSINMIKTILYRIAPNEHIKQAPVKFNVKLKPTIFKTISHQRRIKTEILE